MKRPTFEEQNKSLPHWMRRQIGERERERERGVESWDGWMGWMDGMQCFVVRCILFVTVCCLSSCLVLSTGAVVPLSKLSRPMTGGWVAEFVRWGSTDSMG